MSTSSTKELTVRVAQEHRDVIIALLSHAGYEGFWEKEEGFQAYIPAGAYDSQALEKILDQVGLEKKAVSVNDLSDQNWNESWESNFPPVRVGNLCQIIAHFHKEEPGFDYTVHITPKMSFGTGHHATTRLMIGAMNELDFRGKHVLDMGCGTGILAILAAKMGAAVVDAIDIDVWSYENTLENVRKNDSRQIRVIHGDASQIPARQYDIILANINLNILLQDMAAYAEHLSLTGDLLLSGIRPQDVLSLQQKAGEHHLIMTSYAEDDIWMMGGFERVPG